MINTNNLFTYKTLVHAVAGAAGSVIAMATFYPLDTVRCRLQINIADANNQTNSTIKELQNIILTEGITGLYKGMTPVLQSLSASNFIYFYTFHGLKSAWGGAGDATKDLLLGTISGIVNVLMTNPLWVVNTRLKSNLVQQPFSNLITGIIHVAKTEGIAGLWAGMLPSLLLVSNPAIQFMTYETIKRRLNSTYDKLPAFTFFLIGAIAKTIATFATYPLQLVQTRQRHGGPTVSEGNDTMIKLFINILKKHGIFGLYRGLEAKLLQTVLAAALMFTAYEKIASFVLSLLLQHEAKLNK